jgi:hypothetical protein
MTYTHRNGETEPPTEPGRYWFNGVVWSSDRLGTYNILGIVECLATMTYNDVTGEALPSRDHAGQWWGPMTPPWEANQ